MYGFDPLSHSFCMFLVFYNHPEQAIFALTVRYDNNYANYGYCFNSDNSYLVAEDEACGAQYDNVCAQLGSNYLRTVPNRWQYTLLNHSLNRIAKTITKPG